MSRKNKTPDKKNKTLKNLLTNPTKLNCNPNITDNKVVRGSCLPENVLQLLKESYNQNNLDNQITTTKPRNIWNELKKRMRT